MRENRNSLLAFRDIFINARADDGSPLFEEKSLDHLLTSLQQLLAHFQAAGDFRRDFDPEVMALAIRGAIDQVPPRMARYPDLDVDHDAGELAMLFDLATRAETHPPEE
jgi:hypothetical protein